MWMWMWTGLDWTGSDWIGLDWIGSNQTGWELTCNHPQEFELEEFRRERCSESAHRYQRDERTRVECIQEERQRLVTVFFKN